MWCRGGGRGEIKMTPRPDLSNGVSPTETRPGRKSLAGEGRGRGALRHSSDDVAGLGRHARVVPGREV